MGERRKHCVQVLYFFVAGWAFNPLNNFKLFGVHLDPSLANYVPQKFARLDVKTALGRIQTCLMETHALEAFPKIFNMVDIFNRLVIQIGLRGNAYHFCKVLVDHPLVGGACID